MTDAKELCELEMAKKDDADLADKPLLSNLDDVLVRVMFLIPHALPQTLLIIWLFRCKRDHIYKQSLHHAVMQVEKRIGAIGSIIPVPILQLPMQICFG